MKSNSSSETNAAVQTAGRELIVSALQRNPLVAVATALIGPIIGLFRGRRNVAPTEVRKMKLESYSSSPVSPPTGRRRIRHPAKPDGNPMASRWQPDGNPMPTRCAPEARPMATRCAPEQRPMRLGRTSPPARSAAAVNLNQGGPSHG
jgi:hypothetical protein